MKQIKGYVVVFIILIIVVVLSILDALFHYFDLICNFAFRCLNPFFVRFLRDFTFLFLISISLFIIWKLKKAGNKKRGLEKIVSDIFPDVIIVIDKNNKIAMCSKSVEKVFGWSVEEVMDKDINTFFQNDLKKMLNIYGISKNVDQEHTACIKGKKKNGEEIQLKIFMRTVDYNNGYLIIIRDITEEKALELALRDELSKVKAELARYVAPPTMEVIEKIAKGKEVYAGELVNVTVLFSDIRGFTQISENMNPDELYRMLNLYLSIQIRAVEKYHGIIDKLSGDEVMAVFHGPDMAENALKCAMEIIKQLNNPEIGMERDWIGVGIGINTGPAYSGPIGSESRKQFTLVGTTVNVAARLCGKAKKFEVLFGKTTQELIKDKGFDYQYIGKVPLKGLSVPFEVFQLKYKLD